MMTTTPKRLTKREAADYLRVSERTVDRLLQCFNVRGVVQFRQDDLDTFLLTDNGVSRGRQGRPEEPSLSWISQAAGRPPLTWQSKRRTGPATSPRVQKGS